MSFADRLPDGALTGLRVLDLTQVMSGPFCTMMLADMGADVVKIENPQGGDQTRTSWGYAVRGEDSRAFLALNRNKRSVRLDLKDAAQRERFYAMVGEADVVVENFRPGVTARLGIDYETLKQHNPALIYASISGFGQTGPYAQRPGYDLIAQGMSGIMSITGEPGGNPVKSGLPVADLGAGMFTAFGILTAYVARLASGEGQYLEVSLFESALALSVWESTEYWATGEAPEALGSANRMSAPYQAFRASDGYLTVGANNERLWARLCEVLGVPELVTDERYRTNTLRMRHRDELVAELTPLFSARTVDEWVDELLGIGVPAGPIRDYSYVLDSDPHVAERGAVTSYEHPVEGTVKVLASPVRLSGTPATVRRPAPLLGEHDELLAGAGTGAPALPDGAPRG